MTDRATNLILKAQVDQNLADQGVRALQQLQANADEVRTSFESMFKSQSDLSQTTSQLDETAASVKSIGDAWDKTANSIQTADDRLKQYMQDAEAQAQFEQDKVDPFAAMGQGIGGDDTGDDGSGGSISARGIGALGMLARQAGAGGVGDVLRTVAELQRAQTVFSSLGESIGPAVEGLGGLTELFPPLAIAVGAVAAGVIAFNAAEQQHKTEIDNEIAQTDAYYKVIETGTTKSIELELQKQQIVLKGYQDELAAIQAKINLEKQSPEARLPDAAGNALVNTIPGGGIVNLLTGVGTTVGDKLNPAMGDLQKRSDELTKQITDTQNAIKGETDALGSSQVAANDAAQAEKQLQDARGKAADQAIADATKYEQLLQTGTSKGIESRLGDINVERSAIFDQLNQGGLDTTKVKELNDQLAHLSDEENKLTNDILPAVQAREAEDKATKDATKAFDEFTRSMNELGKVSAEITRMQQDRNAQVAREQADDRRNAERATVEADYQRRIDAAKREEAEQAERDKVAQADAQAQVKYNDDKAKIDANFFDSQLKAYQNYIDTEKQATDRANLQRLQTLEKAQLDLKNLAASGDVAGFVTRSEQAKLDLKNQSENETLADQQRREAFDKQTQANQENYQKQLDDLNTSFAREKAARDQAAADRIQQIEESGKEANTKSAQLERELNDIREQWRRDDLQRQRDLEEQSYEERLQLQQDKQRELLAQTGNFFDQWINDIAQQANAVLQQAQAATPADNTTMTPDEIQAAQQATDYMNRIDSGGSYPEFASGLDYVPQDNYIASLHQGERVLTAQQNRDYTAGQQGSGGDTYNVTVNNTVGDVATKSMLDDYQEATVGGIKQALIQAKGRGSS